MTPSRAPSRWARPAGLAVATALLVLGAPASASAQCADPNYRGTRTFPGGSCPTTVAGTASAGVWAVLVLAAALWLARLLTRSRSTTDADLAMLDAVFTPSEEPASPGRDAPVRRPE
ncbi:MULTISPECIES: hypothetical protein [Streptomyces]|uniref:Uncharacterized protein n=1 Tax=Streptomyces luteosporeus TaxID=173856 RepID=A0ABN3TS82_9ACTN